MPVVSIKTYLTSSMSQDRLNHLMVMHIHKELADKFNLLDVANDFVAVDDSRVRVFGTFKINIVCLIS